MTTLAAPESLFGELEVWQFGLIIGVASLVIIAILLSGVVWMAGLTIRRRRETRRRRSRGRSHATTNSSNQVAYKKNVAPATRNQPKSMLEEIQMMETIEEEDTDFGS